MSEFDDASQPVECYEFWISDSGFYRYTSDAKSVVAEGKSYQPLRGLSRTKLACVVSSDAGEFFVQLPATSTLARLCGMFKTPAKVTLVMKRYQRDNLSTPTMQYSAILDGASIDEETCKFKLPDTYSNATASAIPRHKAQGQCNWNLADSNCGKNVSQWLITFKSAQIGGTYGGTYAGDPKTLILDGSGYTGPAYNTGQVLPGGVLEATRSGVVETRSINKFQPHTTVTNTSGLMTINSPFNLPVDDGTKFRVSVIGCDNSIDNCKRLDNLSRYGGFPYMPTEKYNPFLVQLTRARRP